ncbi:MAG: UPF0178 protein Daro_2879 [uncultured Campylobacterales bacterium]|uniref:UPF0178 protein HELGO_WM21468 n=1 Tax=uncultured Campylobacterales bacterium TaxID=352960 RepID=A0A6S6T783_9BACT|nr:MAG: UPF0178 protein Daro_2879 [uncultured Campylobacterales bacterium]
MKLYIDGDAFPNLLKPIVYRAIKRLELLTYVVANKKISIGEKSSYIEYIIVEQGADEADNYIVDIVNEGDLVITADIPLADRIIDKKAHALDHRGELYTKDNIKSFLRMRDLMAELRESGELIKGPAPFGAKDASSFANALNRFLTKYNR